MPPALTPAFLREAFAARGRPEALRVDNGTPWVSTGGMPTALELWLAGLGVRLLRNPPRRPQHNGVVERSQGTGKSWAEPWQCQSAARLQARVDEADRRQRESYPFRQGRSRMQVYPELRHSGREYSRRWERSHWDMALARGALAEAVVGREVDQNGCVSLYSRNVYVGRPWARTTVFVRYDPQGGRWMFSDAHGRLLQHQSAPEISRDSVLALTASDGRSKRDPLD